MLLLLMRKINTGTALKYSLSSCLEKSICFLNNIITMVVKAEGVLSRRLQETLNELNDIAQNETKGVFFVRQYISSYRTALIL